MKKRDNLPLNYKERLNSRTSFLVSIAVLVVLCLVFNQDGLHHDPPASCPGEKGS